MQPRGRFSLLATVLLLFASCFLCAPVVAAQTVRVGVYNFAPLVFVENGQVKGFYVDMLQNVVEREKWELQFVPGSWDECLERLKLGKIDLLPSIAQTPEREQHFRFSKGVFPHRLGCGLQKKGLEHSLAF